MQAGPNDFPPYNWVFIPALAIAFWCFICFVIGIVSGWFSLSRRFRAQDEPCGETKSAGPFFYTVHLRFWLHYSSLIRVTAAGDALYLSVLFPFSFGHSPLFIPWKEIQIGRTKFLWRSYVVLTLGEQERIPMRISERMAGKLGILERLPG
ncbi:MAG: hypothetical protein ABR898_08410 [Terracidiphilus sp.]|jgi:hypothetical protein